MSCHRSCSNAQVGWWPMGKSFYDLHNYIYGTYTLLYVSNVLLKNNRTPSTQIVASKYHFPLKRKEGNR